MRKLQLIFVLAITLIAAFGFASRNDPPASNGEDREFPGGILNAEMFDLPWISGEWQHVAAASEDFKIEIERREIGVYLIKADNFMSGATIYLIRSGCERLAIIDSPQDGRGGSVMFARVSGFSERLSLDLIPVVFPMAWSDPEIHKVMGIERDGELPKEHRLAALALFAETIDTKGTFMEQDLTFYRPISLREMREMLNEQPPP